MPALGNHLNFAQYEARSMAVHNANPAPSSPVKGQLYFNNVSNELFYWDGSIWQSAKSGAGSSGPPSGPAGGDLGGTYPNPLFGTGKLLDAHVNGSAAIAESKLALASDAAAGTASRRTLGTGAQQAAPGNDSRFTDARAPSGPAGGDLSGTYPNPQIKAGTIVLADMDATLTDGDGAKCQPRFLSNGGNPSHALPASSMVGDLQLPTYPLSMNSQKITNLADPTATTDAATKAYVDGLAQGLDAKQSVKYATTGNVSNMSGSQVIDGQSTGTGDRVLVKDQTTPSQNGIWVSAVGAWTRATDADAWAELPGAFVFVEAGPTYADTGWVCTVDQGGTLGTTGITWVQFSGAGQITSGAGLTKTGNTLDVGQGNGLQVQADTVGIATGGVVDGMIASGNLDPNKLMSAVPITKGGTGATTAAAARTGIGAAGVYFSGFTNPATTSWVISTATHGLGSGAGKLVQVTDLGSGQIEFPDVVIQGNGIVTITWGVAPAANSKAVMIVG